MTLMRHVGPSDPSTALVTDRPPVPQNVARRLSDDERAAVLAVLHEPRFVDQAPPQIHAHLLDEGRYLCSVSTMYRLLRAAHEIAERRNVARHPQYAKPELLAAAPNCVWSWDATKVRGLGKGEWFTLLVMIDIFSRYVVGWMLVRRSNAKVAGRFIAETVKSQNIVPGELSIHADRGTEMTAQSVSQLFDALGIAESHSRPHVSDDNPYSESQFRGMKYHPTYPDRFGSFADARAYFSDFFAWYNGTHRHSGIAMLPPAVVHEGRHVPVLAARHAVMTAAFERTPDRWICSRPKLAQVQEQVWINAPIDGRLESTPG
ncbi:MAG: IS3 family transposase [Candidatus Velthaea sp.]